MWLLPFLAVATAINPALAAPTASDACSNIAGKPYVVPQDAVACLKSFPFNETLRENVLTVVERMIDWYPDEYYYLNLPAPFHNSSVNIRDRINKIRQNTYTTDFDFNMDLFFFISQLNDAHTTYFPYCYRSFQNLLPITIVSLDIGNALGVYIDFNLVDIMSQMPPGFLQYYESVGFNWQRLAGAKVLQIDGQNPYDYVDYLADTVAGSFLDKSIRANSVYSGYSLSGKNFSQTLGAFASNPLLEKDSLNLQLITANSTAVENVTVPYLAMYGLPNQFNDSASFWQANCAATNTTNGVDRHGILIPYPGGNNSSANSTTHKRQLFERGEESLQKRAGLKGPIQIPQTSLPTAQLVGNISSSSNILSYILPEKKTGVLVIGDFVFDTFAATQETLNEYQKTIVSSISAFKNAGSERLLIDLSRNKGGFICLGTFLEEYLVGSKNGQGGFTSAFRGDIIEEKIVGFVSGNSLNTTQSMLSSGFFTFPNGTVLPNNYNYLSPPLSNSVNGQSDPTSQILREECKSVFTQPIPEDPPFNLSNIVIVTNGMCPSTCAQFTTALYEKYNVTIAAFGGRPGNSIEYKGCAGGEVFLWTQVDSEIKTAGLKSDSNAAPDLLVNSQLSVNIRNAYSFKDPKTPIAYCSEKPQHHFAYTKDTYNKPQSLWEFTIEQIFKV